MGASAPPRNDAEGKIRFIKWQELYEHEKPFWIFLDPPKDTKDQRTTNLVFEEKKILFHDVRDEEDTFNLDDHAFAFKKHSLRFEDFENFEAVEKEYLPEVEAIIKAEVGGADKVFIFDWRLRRSFVEEGTVVDLNKPTDWLRPSMHAHIDHAPSAVFKRILVNLPEEADNLLKGRVRVLNVWRPLKYPVEDYPLGVCDGSTVRAEDLVETDYIRRLYTGATVNILYNPNHRWFYLNKQTKDEVIILKLFDYSREVKANGCPHAAFFNPMAEPGTPNRESIEVRALVFNYT